MRPRAHSSFSSVERLKVLPPFNAGNTWLAALAATLGMYRNESVYGDAVSWSFFVNGPLKTLYRSTPLLTMMRLGIPARVLLMAKATGAASVANSVNTFSLDGYGFL